MKSHNSGTLIESPKSIYLYVRTESEIQNIECGIPRDSRISSDGVIMVDPFIYFAEHYNGYLNALPQVEILLNRLILISRAFAMA